MNTRKRRSSLVHSVTRNKQMKRSSSKETKRNSKPKYCEYCAAMHNLKSLRSPRKRSRSRKTVRRSKPRKMARRARSRKTVRSKRSKRRVNYCQKCGAVIKRKPIRKRKTRRAKARKSKPVKRRQTRKRASTKRKMKSRPKRVAKRGRK